MPALVASPIATHPCALVSYSERQTPVGGGSQVGPPSTASHTAPNEADATDAPTRRAPIQALRRDEAAGGGTGAALPATADVATGAARVSSVIRRITVLSAPPMTVISSAAGRCPGALPWTWVGPSERRMGEGKGVFPLPFHRLRAQSPRSR